MYADISNGANDPAGYSFGDESRANGIWKAHARDRSGHLRGP